MAGPIISAPADRHGLSPVIQRILDALSVNPIATGVPAQDAEPIIRSIGKPLQELLGRVFTPSTPGTGLPKRISLTGWNAPKNAIGFHGTSRAAQDAFEASPQQLDELLRSGAIDLQQPAQGSVDAIRRRIEAALTAAGK